MLELHDIALEEVVDGQSTDELLKKLLLRLLSAPQASFSASQRFDRLEAALLEGMRRGRSRTFGSNG